MKQGWEIVRLGDVIELVYGKPLPNEKRSPNGSYPIYGANGEIGRTNVFYHRKKTIIVGRKGSAGELNLTEERFWPLDVTYFVEFNEKKVDLVFIYHLLSILELPKLAKGVKPGINRNDVYSIKVPLPPLPEQLRIVRLLDEAFASITKAKANVEQNLKNARELFESYLQSVFANKVEGWVVKTLGEIGKVSMCKRIYKNQTASNGDIPFYKIGTFGKEPDAFISYNIYNEYREKYSFPKNGDILISASGTIGRRVKYDGKPAYFQDSNIMWIDNDEKQVLNDYLFYFYGACKWNSTKGATISRLYYDNLKPIEIAFPKSRTEQQSIVQKLDYLSSETKKLEAIYLRKLYDLVDLKKSILQKAFNGELKAS